MTRTTRKNNVAPESDTVGTMALLPNSELRWGGSVKTMISKHLGANTNFLMAKL